MLARWLLVIPPEGAARQAALDLHAAALQSPEAPNLKTFDTKAYLEGFAKLLRQPDDDMRVDLMNQGLVVSALDHAATHVLVTALAPVTAFTANLLRRQGLKLFHWFIEDSRQAHYWRQVLPAYDSFFAIQTEAIESACANAGCRFAVLPTAVSPELAMRPVKPWAERDLDFAFVGLPSPYRLAVLDALLAAGAKLALGGSGWGTVTGPLRSCVVNGEAMLPREAFALLERARFGVHMPYEDPAPDRANTHVSPRLYDLLALGCRVLCEDAPLLRQAMSGYAVTFAQGPQGMVKAWQAESQAEDNAKTHTERFAGTGLGTPAGAVADSPSDSWQHAAQSNRERVLTLDSYTKRWRRLQELAGQGEF
jgi:hypothetical protein